MLFWFVFFLFPFNLTVCLLTVQVALPALAALAGSQLRTSNQSRNQPATNQQSHEMTVPNELIGCIIGKVCVSLTFYYPSCNFKITLFRQGKGEGKKWDETLLRPILPFSLAWYFSFFKLKHNPTVFWDIVFTFCENSIRITHIILLKINSPFDCRAAPRSLKSAKFLAQWSGYRIARNVKAAALTEPSLYPAIRTLSRLRSTLSTWGKSLDI